jgi:NAD+-dependent secondary alcohol dehydrogenase Adh1
MRAMVMKSIVTSLDGSPLELEEVATPRAVNPTDVVVRITAAGVCRTDLHLLTGEMESPLPLILGHENAGYVHEIGSGVTTIAVGDPVICFPFISDGLSVQERAGLDTDAPGRTTPGINVNGGYAEFLLTNERSMLKVPVSADLAQLATLTDAGLAAYRACTKAAEMVRPGDTVMIVGVGGLGHLAVQIVKAISPARIVAVDTNPAARSFALECRADVAVSPDQVSAVLPQGVRACLDFVGLDMTAKLGVESLSFGGAYFAVGVGGSINTSLADIVTGERRIEGVYVGTYTDLVEVSELTISGKITPRVVRYSLSRANTALRDLSRSSFLGRAVLVPEQ